MLALLAGLGCSREKSSTGAANAAPGERKITVAAAQVEGQEVQRTVQIVGTLIAQEEVTLGTEVPSTVAKILVDMGDRVQAGQVVIKLDEREARLEVERLSASLQAARESLGRSQQVLESSRANVERSQAVLADARINLKRFEGLFGEGAISASQRDSAQTQFDVAVASLRASEAQYESDRASVKNAEASVVQATAALDIARKRLQDTDVASPITGVVRKRLVNVGETFKEKTPLMSLVATNALKLQGDVPERFAPQISVGRAVRVEVEAYPDQTYPGTITRVSPTVDVESRSFQVEASVPNPKGLLKPGFFAKASILVGAETECPVRSRRGRGELCGNREGVRHRRGQGRGASGENRRPAGRPRGNPGWGEGGGDDRHLQPRPARHRHGGDGPGRAPQRWWAATGENGRPGASPKKTQQSS